MDIFTKFDPKTWIKDTGYPCIKIVDPETYDLVYSGRNPKEYFEEFDIEYYQDYVVSIWFDSSGYTKMGTIKSLNGKLPEFKLDFVWNEV
jgi:hypothetical protein